MSAHPPNQRLRPASALRDALAGGYNFADLVADVQAGIVVGIVALPLSMALAIASGVAPQHGLYTAIVAGGLIALLGGSRNQVSGPTAAFVVLLSPLAARYGLGGLLLATLMAGPILIAFGIARLGRLIEYVPYPVTTGFTTGIAIVIATLQIKDLLGLPVPRLPEHYLARVWVLARALPGTRWQDVLIGGVTMAVLLGWPAVSRIIPNRRLARLLPSPLIALVTGAVIAAALTTIVPGFEVATINSRFEYVSAGITHAGVPRLAPTFVLPWRLPGGDGQPLVVSLQLIRELLGPALAIALLGAIESLLSAVVADGMTGHKHDPDAELLAQGLGNLVVPFFGGICATGAIARTATAIRAGGRSPLASIVHSLFLLSAVLTLAPLLGWMPMASLAALLLQVAWNMGEARHVARSIRTAPGSDVIVLLTCISLTVIFDMVVAVLGGMVLASLLFMRRMVEVSGVSLRNPGDAHTTDLPAHALVYEIAGPLFFGAAQRAMGSLSAITIQANVIILDLRAVPAMDQTGVVNLESAVDRLTRAGKLVILAGLQPQPGRVVARAGLHPEDGRLIIVASLEEASACARAHAAPGVR